MEIRRLSESVKFSEERRSFLTKDTRSSFFELRDISDRRNYKGNVKKSIKLQASTLTNYLVVFVCYEEKKCVLIC